MLRWVLFYMVTFANLLGLCAAIWLGGFFIYNRNMPGFRSVGTRRLVLFLSIFLSLFLLADEALLIRFIFYKLP